MANEQDLQWLAEPLAPGEVRLHVALGEGTQLTPEMRDALEQLVRAVQAEHSEVQGYEIGDIFQARGPQHAGAGHQAPWRGGPAAKGWDLTSKWGTKV